MTAELEPDEFKAVSEPGTTTGARSPTRRIAAKRPESLDRVEKMRLKSGDPLLVEPVVPSGASHPVEAQRDFRGKIVIVILVLIIIAAIQVVLVVRRVADKTIVYAPTAERIGASTSRKPNAVEQDNFARMFIAEMEGWNATSVQRVWHRMLPYLHPSLHQSMKSQYEQLAVVSRALWQSRVAVPLGAVNGGENAGVTTIAVYYQQVELVGRTTEERRVQAIVNKAAWVQIVQDAPTDDNPLGLYIMQYKTFDMEDAKKVGIPDLWSKYLEGSGP